MAEIHNFNAENEVKGELLIAHYQAKEVSFKKAYESKYGKDPTKVDSSTLQDLRRLQERTKDDLFQLEERY